jgi:hypothetical protein
MLSNWLNTVKNNNVGLYDSMIGNHNSEQNQNGKNDQQKKDQNYPQVQVQDQ